MSRDLDLSLSFAPKVKNVENNEPGGSLLSSLNEAKQPRTMMSWDLDLSSFFTREEKNEETTMSLSTRHHLLQLKKKCRKQQ